MEVVLDDEVGKVDAAHDDMGMMDYESMAHNEGDMVYEGMTGHVNNDGMVHNEGEMVYEDPILPLSID